jgi:uncharacterized protein
LRFEWDPAKAESNLRSHGVDFELAITEQDRIEGGEYRWQTLGMVEGNLLLLVAHVDRDEDDVPVVRIVSARVATPKERRHYAQDRQA